MADEAKQTLTWQMPMTSFQASKYHLTYGFIAAELYDATVRERDGLRNDYELVKVQRDHLWHVLWRLLKDYDEERQAILVEPDPGCQKCTQNSTPKSLETGLCPYHAAIAAIERENESEVQR